MLIVNLFGAPCAGKSTGAAYIFSKLKMAGVNAELVTEFAKDKVWEESKQAFNNQMYLFGEQYFRITRLNSKVDVVITDSPIVLSAFYNIGNEFSDEFNPLVVKIHNTYNNLNVFIDRVKDYSEVGRLHTQRESDELYERLVAFLDEYNIDCSHYNGSLEGYDKIVNDILNTLNNGGIK